MLDVTRLNPDHKPMAIYQKKDGSLWVTLMIGPRQLEEIKVGTRKDIKALHQFYHIDYKPPTLWAKVSLALGITAYNNWRWRVAGKKKAAKMLENERRKRNATIGRRGLEATTIEARKQ